MDAERLFFVIRHETLCTLMWLALRKFVEYTEYTTAMNTLSVQQVAAYETQPKMKIFDNITVIRVHHWTQRRLLKSHTCGLQRLT